MLAAADTFRAGASEQLAIWASRLQVPCVTGSAKGDPAAVAFDAVESATARGTDVVLIDTAGRLHTHHDLMEELRKLDSLDLLILTESDRLEVGTEEADVIRELLAHRRETRSVLATSVSGPALGACSDSTSNAAPLGHFLTEAQWFSP